MADVDLSVEVRSAGLTSAVAQVESLRKAGLDTGQAMQQLGDKFSYALSRSQNLATASRGTTDALKNSEAVIQKNSNAVATLQANYARLAALSPKLTAFQRLSSNLGTGGLAGGLRIAKNMEAYNNALNASPVRDRIIVEQQLAAVEEARSAKLSAQTNLQKANTESAQAGMNRQQQAQARLTQAQQEYTAALQRNAEVSRLQIRSNTDPGVAATKLREQAAALDQVAAARRNLTTAEEDVTQANAARLQQSYGYFILAGLLSQVTGQVVALGTATLSSSATIERSFADVERTFQGSNDQLDSLRAKLVELSTTTPNSFVDLAGIATLGNQLGIAAGDIENFTSVIAQYTAVSGQSAEDSATAFGRISNLTGLASSQYRNLASAITYTARTTVATEATIQRTATEITALASGAGFSADAIVGLAGALSSLAIPPERARGALSLYFGALNSAVAEGGPKLEAFAALTGLTADQLEKLVRENKGQEVFTDFIKGLSDLDSVAKTSALDTLGLSTIRVDQTMRALAQNVPLVTSAFEGANSAFAAGTDIGSQYAIIQATLNSSWIEFQSAVQNAAGAVGDEFAPAAAEALKVITSLLVGLQEFSKSPLGAAFVKVAAAAAVFIGALAGGLGIFALSAASLVVLRFSIAQLGWSSSTVGLTGWIAAMITGERETRAAAVAQAGFRASLKETTGNMLLATFSARGLAVAMNLLKVALPLIAISAAIALFQVLGDEIDKAQNPYKNLTDDLTGLSSALKEDNAGLFVKSINDTASAASGADAPVSAFNASILTAIAAQERAEAATKGTTNAIDGQTLSLGKASKAWIAQALAASKQITDIIAGPSFSDQVGNAIAGALDFGNSGSADQAGRSAGTIINKEQLKNLIKGGLDLSALSEEAITSGKKAALKTYEDFQKGYKSAHPKDTTASAFGDAVLPGILDSVIDAYGKASVAAALNGDAIGQSGAVAVAAASDYDSLGNYIGNAVKSGDAAVVTFSGITGRLSDFRDAIQGAIKGYVDFDAVMQRANDTQKAIADAKGKKAVALPVDAAGFGKALKDSVSDATTFYTNIQALASKGSTSFALQLAQLGPQASAILGQSLNLDPAAAADLEGSARFAAFLASDAFKTTLEAQMSDSNQAYARIFQTTGNLSDVQSFIAAQVAGTSDEWEKQWDLHHPNLPLNVTPELANPSDSDIAIWSQINSGKITITPTLLPPKPGAQGVAGQTGIAANKYTDTATGKSIVLPASLDGKALSASLSAWQAGGTAAQIKSKLNTTGLNSDIDNWVQRHGPIRMTVSISSVSNVPGIKGQSVVPKPQRGGLVSDRDSRFAGAFASGGLVRGSGTNTSDSIWAQVSMGERIFAADRERFWGHDFMDSLDRKMLPVAFTHMLAAASVSGNSGPQRTTNVKVVQNYPQTVNPLKDLRADSENIIAGIWG